MSEALARWLLNVLGLIPVSKAVEYARFEETLQKLGYADANREAVIECAAMLAKVGVTLDDVTIFARTWAGRHDA